MRNKRGKTKVMKGGRGTARTQWRSALEQGDGEGQRCREKLLPPDHNTPHTPGHLEGLSVSCSDIKGGTRGTLSNEEPRKGGGKVLSSSV